MVSLSLVPVLAGCCVLGFPLIVLTPLEKYSVGKKVYVR